MKYHDRQIESDETAQMVLFSILHRPCLCSFLRSFLYQVLCSPNLTQKYGPNNGFKAGLLDPQGADLQWMSFCWMTGRIRIFRRLAGDWYARPLAISGLFWQFFMAISGLLWSFHRFTWLRHSGTADREVVFGGLWISCDKATPVSFVINLHDVP